MGDIVVYLSILVLFKEYYKDFERMKKQICGDYFFIGDCVKKDEDGYFWFESCNDDIIVSFGYIIGFFEVEDVFVKYLEVKECVVVVSLDEIRGLIVKVYVVL